MCLPAGQGWLEPLDQIGANVQPAGAGPATEPLDAAANGEVDPEPRYVERNRARRLVRVEHDERAGLVGPPDDRLDVLDLAGLEENVADRHEEGSLVDGLEHRVGVCHDLDVRAPPALRLVEVANRGKLSLAVDDPVPGWRELEAREHDRLRDGDVLVHHGRPGRGADDPRELVADARRRLPPPFRPRAHAALAPLACVPKQVLLRAEWHRPERVADQVGRVLEDWKTVAVALERLHGV